MLLPLLLALCAQDLQSPNEKAWQEALPILGDVFMPEEIVSDLKIYDVADFVDTTPTLNPKESKRREQALDEFVEVMRSKMSPALRRGLSSLDIAGPAHLLVFGDKAVQTFVETYLAAQRRNQQVGFQVNMTMFRLPHGILENRGVMGSSKLFETKAEYESLRQALLENQQVETLSAPNLAVFPRALATISMINQVAYVSDYELRIVEPGSTEILDPTVSVAQDGVLADVRVVPMADGRFDLELNVSFSQLERPMQTRKVRMGAGAGFEVEVTQPVINTLSIGSLFSMDSGASALVATTSEDRLTDVAVMLEFARIEIPVEKPSMRVTSLFDAMRAGAYSHRWFPPLEWADLSGLLMQSQISEAVNSFPKSPLSSVRPPQVITGVVALWLIEGLLEDGHIPSFAPLLVEQGHDLDASPAKQRELLIPAREAYQNWYRSLQAGAAQAKDACPLDAIGLRWY